MAKINYSHAEKSLDINTKKMFIERIINMTKDDPTEEEKLKSKKHKERKQLTGMLLTLKKDIELMSERSDELWNDLGFSKEDVSTFIKSPRKLSKKEWGNIRVMFKKLQKYKKEMGKEIEKEINNDLVSDQRIKQQDLRFNTNKKWKSV